MPIRTHRKGGILINTQFKKGVLDLCVLSVLEKQDCYGWDLISRISEHIEITEGTIYPLLRRLKDDGQLTTYLQESSDGPPRKYYRITQSGLENLRAGRQEWLSFAQGVSTLLACGGPASPGNTCPLKGDRIEHE